MSISLASETITKTTPSQNQTPCFQEQNGQSKLFNYEAYDYLAKIANLTNEFSNQGLLAMNHNYLAILISFHHQIQIRF